MRILLAVALIFTLRAVAVIAQNPPDNDLVRRIDADKAKGFSYPYYLISPKSTGVVKARPILVSPNNTGSGNDDLAVHDENVKRRVAQMGFAFGKLDVPILMPVFPRPKENWKIYTHALDRDSVITEKLEYARFDLQLIAMIEDARRRLAEAKIPTDKRILMYGFSAAGMFTNRFAFLHPDRVIAAAVGSPGGWPIAPASEFAGKKLRYPVGTGDLKAVAGKELNIAQLRKVRFLVFLGDKDDNDSVVFGDGYEPEDKDLVFELFGKTPIERWETSKKLYADARLNAEFKLYPGIGHTVTLPMITDVSKFFETAIN